MNHHYRLSLTTLCIIISVVAMAQRERICFDQNWHFARGNAADPTKDFGCGTEYFNYFAKANSIHNTGPYSMKFQEDSLQWKDIDLPYDFAVDLPFAEKASYSHGHKTVGWQYPETSIGWYRKKFNIPESDRGKHIRLQFDGIFRDAQIWVNGFLVGHESSGYKHQDYDITDYLLYGDGQNQTNLVCVRADATFEEGWFYEGAGIYRHTWLTKSAPLHISTDGVFVHADLSPDFQQARVYVETDVCNESNDNTSPYQLLHEIIAPDGHVVARMTSDGTQLLPRSHQSAITTTVLKNPLLWSLQRPYLYKVRTKIMVKGLVIDSCDTRTGFRSIRMDKDYGLFLNGVHVKIQGFNNHQDHAGVGAAIPDGLQRYRIERMKSFGANAYRASHNPMTTELLDICDELGMLVFEENRLMGINDFQLSVAENMIRHDRNHPSVFLWGIANEEWGVEGDERGVGMARTMCERFHRIDSTRLVAVASAGGPKILEGTDVAGYNYIKQHPIDAYRQRFPDRIAFGSEETTGCGTRGVYYHELSSKYDGTHTQQDEGDLFRLANPSGRMPSLNRFADTDSTYNRIERGMKFYAARPWLMGFFYWTGFDYRGEPVPLSYPATGSQFGVFDYCGFPKDEAYYLKACWIPDKPIVHLLPHWNLEGHEGENVDIWAYSNCEEVELFVNGKNMGRKTMPQNGHLSWTAIYQPGKLEAIGYIGGRKVTSEHLETAGSAKNVRIEKHTYHDITVADISVIDSKGRLVPTSCAQLTVESDVNMIGWGNGDSAFTGMEHAKDLSTKQMHIRAFNGHAQVILNSKGKPCKLNVSL